MTILYRANANCSSKLQRKVVLYDIHTIGTGIIWNWRQATCQLCRIDITSRYFHYISSFAFHFVWECVCVCIVVGWLILYTQYDNTSAPRIFAPYIEHRQLMGRRMNVYDVDIGITIWRLFSYSAFYCISCSFCFVCFHFIYIFLLQSMQNSEVWQF